MTLTISTSKQEKSFDNKDFITIGNNPQCDFYIDFAENCMLTIHFDKTGSKCVITNNFQNEKILFKGKPITERIVFDNICKLMIADSEEYISLRLSKSEKPQQNNISPEENLVLTKIEKRKSDLEKYRIAITKQIAFSISDIKKRLSVSSKTGIFLNIALFISSLVTAFGITNYLMGLPIEMSANFTNMPTNIKVLFIFSLAVYGISLILKQGIYLMLQNIQRPESKFAQNIMLTLSGIFMIAFYAINLIYYMNPDGRIVFATFISLFFIGLNVTIAIGSGYFKFNNRILSMELDKYEFREDFERVLNEYQIWISRYINSLGTNKLNYIKDKMFMLQLKGLGETIVGILTAPFLAYGVSNTLAMCFPEAAGWIRISGLRFSPIFLVLATLLIIFAFFSFVNSFVCGRKISGSDVIKLDGFRDYISHGTDIYGLENTRKIHLEKNRALIIGVAIIFIEFSMNVSYFMTEIGGDMQGILLSLVSALVPTALLIAETYMLSKTKYDIYVSDSLLAKLDK